jgi:hypothetical protein
MNEEKEEIKENEMKYNLVYKNDDIAIFFRARDEEE